jgi:hypothetical protein
VTIARSDPGLVVDAASLGPAKRSFLPAGFTNGQVFTGLGILLGFSAENSGATDNSLDAAGQVTGPAANAVIASLVLPAGTYVVSWQVGYGPGAVAAVENDNMQLRGVPTPLTALIQPVANVEAAQTPVTFTTAGTTISVNAIAAGTATAQYEAQMVATPVVAGFARLYDSSQGTANQLASSYLGQVGSETEWFGDAGVQLLRGLFVAVTSPSIAIAVYYVPLLGS